MSQMIYIYARGTIMDLELPVYASVVDAKFGIVEISHRGGSVRLEIGPQAAQFCVEVTEVVKREE